MATSKTYLSGSNIVDISNSPSKILKILGIVILIWILIYLITSIFVTVESGFVGVKYRF
jgi:hypothetical protein